MSLPSASDKPLFTPGPLTTSQTVKQAMLRDLGSRDDEFIGVVRQVRDELLAVAGVSQAAGYESVLMQGSGTFTVESVLSSTIPSGGKLLVIINGAYGERINKIAHAHGIETHVLRYEENAIPKLNDIATALSEDPDIFMVAVVHCETTSGIMNPIEEIGQLTAEHQRQYFVDSMSAFGAVEFDFSACQIDYLVSSANKCIESVPGFGFAICRRESLLATEGWSRTISLDLLAQWNGLEKSGQFRFTPPTHVILAFQQALAELRTEGGVAARAKRYQRNHACLRSGMNELGFAEYVAPELQGHIITSYLYPDDEQFTFDKFYEGLNERGFVIYPGKVTGADCFRIGSIGRLFPNDVESLLAAIERVMQDIREESAVNTA